jgi:hypothetical protein
MNDIVEKRGRAPKLNEDKLRNSTDHAIKMVLLKNCRGERHLAMGRRMLTQSVSVLSERRDKIPPMDIASLRFCIERTPDDQVLIIVSPGPTRSKDQPLTAPEELKNSDKVVGVNENLLPATLIIQIA